MDEPKDFLGYTNDGKVFWVFYTQIDSRPCQIRIEWDVEHAISVSESIKNAAIEAQKRRTVQ